MSLSPFFPSRWELLKRISFNFLVFRVLTFLLLFEDRIKLEVRLTVRYCTAVIIRYGGSEQFQAAWNCIWIIHQPKLLFSLFCINIVNCGLRPSKPRGQKDPVDYVRVGNTIDRTFNSKLPTTPDRCTYYIFTTLRANLLLKPTPRYPSSLNKGLATCCRILG